MWQILDDLHAYGRIARHDRDIGHRVNEAEAFHALEPAFQEHLPPAGERNRHDAGSEPLERGELGGRGVIRDDRSERDAAVPGAPGKTKRHVPGAGGVDALGERARVDRADRISRPSNLERPDRLKRFQLEPDLARPVEWETDQRRADRGVLDPFPRLSDRIERNPFRQRYRHRRRPPRRG